MLGDSSTGIIHSWSTVVHTLTVIFVIQGIMLVYDITQEKTFDNISKWLRNIEEVIMIQNNNLTSKEKGCPILQQIYAWHCIVLYPPDSRLTIQYNWQRSNTIECNTIPFINLSEHWTILQKKGNCYTMIDIAQVYLCCCESCSKSHSILPLF